MSRFKVRALIKEIILRVAPSSLRRILTVERTLSNHRQVHLKKAALVLHHEASLKIESEVEKEGRKTFTTYTSKMTEFNKFT